MRHGTNARTIVSRTKEHFIQHLSTSTVSANATWLRRQGDGDSGCLVSFCVIGARHFPADSIFCCRCDAVVILNSFLFALPLSLSFWLFAFPQSIFLSKTKRMLTTSAVQLNHDHAIATSNHCGKQMGKNSMFFLFLFISRRSTTFPSDIHSSQCHCLPIALLLLESNGDYCLYGELSVAHWHCRDQRKQGSSSVAHATYALQCGWSTVTTVGACGAKGRGHKHESDARMCQICHKTPTAPSPNTDQRKRFPNFQWKRYFKYLWNEYVNPANKHRWLCRRLRRRTMKWKSNNELFFIFEILWTFPQFAGDDVRVGDAGDGRDGGRWSRRKILWWNIQNCWKASLYGR